eukprot:SAG31_NODE_3863_length_3810_cov_9.181083_4_plen_109_part_00
MRARYTRLASLLDAAGVPYLKPQAGLFIWLDLRRWLDDRYSDPVEAERALALRLMKEVGVAMTPGLSMRMPSKCAGFFRIVFTAASDEQFAVATKRLENFFGISDKRT